MLWSFTLLPNMSLVEHLLKLRPTSLLTLAIFLVPVLVILGHLVPWIAGLRPFPGPWLARFSDLWLGFIVPQGHHSEVVHDLHKKYGEARARVIHSNRNARSQGTFVRIAPNHLSIADANALQIVYSSVNGLLKSNFYDAFVSITPNVFTTRDRVVHARKRKIFLQAFSQKNLLEFEPYVKNHVISFLEQWDRLCASHGCQELTRL